MSQYNLLYMLIAISTIQLISVVLILVFLFLGFKVLETGWSSKISKPYKWENAVENGEVSPELKNIESSYHDKIRFYNFWFQVVRLKQLNVAGAFAELGVYQGETARMLHEMDKSRKLHLFDTFQGFDAKDLKFENGQDKKYSTTNFSDTSLEKVKKFINGNENVFYHLGYFPDTAKNIVEEKFALVHLDADLYQPTLAGLEYFYSRLSPGGLIIVHDYNHTWKGINNAVDEFIKTIPESAIELTDWKGSVMIVKNFN